jgi:hypothetical protein
MTDVQAEALFASDVQPSQHAPASSVRSAVTATLCRLGEPGCAAVVAQECGEHPEAACERMRWARAATAEAFALETVS